MGLWNEKCSGWICVFIQRSRLFQPSHIYALSIAVILLPAQVLAHSWKPAVTHLCGCQRWAAWCTAVFLAGGEKLDLWCLIIPFSEVMGCICCSGFASQQPDPVRVSITPCCCELCLLGSQLQLLFALCYLCPGLRMLLAPPATPSHGKAKLSGFQTLSAVLCDSPSPVCGLQEPGKALSWKLAGAACPTAWGRRGVCPSVSPLARLCCWTWTWVYLASARNVFWEGSTWVLHSVSNSSLWELPVMSKDSLTCFLFRGKDWQSFRFWWNSGMLELAEFPLSACCCELVWLE